MLHQISPARCTCSAQHDKKLQHGFDEFGTTHPNATHFVEVVPALKLASGSGLLQWPGLSLLFITMWAGKKAVRGITCMSATADAGMRLVPIAAFQPAT